jgi:hypothetical protein
VDGRIHGAEEGLTVCHDRFTAAKFTCSEMSSLFIITASTWNMPTGSPFVRRLSGRMCDVCVFSPVSGSWPVGSVGPRMGPWTLN